MNVKNLMHVLLSGTSLMLFSHYVQAVEDADEYGEPQQCISLTHLDRTDIVDDRNILFYMRGKDIYLNQLPNRCSGLRMADGFSYRRTVNQLCNIDLIRPFRSWDMRGGISCGLGTFKLITEDQVLAMKEEKPPETDLQGDGSEIESIDDEAPNEAAEIESIE